MAASIRKIIASRFGDLAFRTGLLDEIDKLAREFADGPGWPEGWVGVRTAIRRWKKRGAEEALEKLEALASFLHPSNLPELVRSYALTKEWTALDVADVEETADDEPGAARERVYEFCIDLGRKLVSQPEVLDSLLPEILTSGAHKTFALGRGIAAECRSPEEMWAYLASAYLGAPDTNRNWNLLAGFVEETNRRSAPDCEAILDGVLSDPRLHPQFVYFQAYAGLSGASLRRLLAALDAQTVPTGTFQILETGRVHEGLDDSQFSEFILRLCKRPDGLPVAFEILGMRVFGAQSEKRPVNEPIKVLGRELLSQVSFESKGPHYEFVLARIIEAALDRPEDYDLAVALCARIVDNLSAGKINVFDIDEIVKALSKTCPRAVLDTLVETIEENRMRRLFSDIRETRPDPLADLPEETILEWAAGRPDTRFPALSHAIRFADANEDAASKHWSSVALKIIALAPDPEKVLGIFLDRFEPMSWMGSRAEIMATRIPLIEALAGHARPEVAAWPGKVLPDYEARVAAMRAREAARDKERDERFEA